MQLALDFFNDQRLARWWCQQPAFLQGAGYAGLVLAFVGLSLGTPSFIYFQF